MTALVTLSLLLAQDDPRKMAVDRNPDVRVRAVRAFGERPDPEAVRALIPFLADPHPRVRHRTVKTLAQLQDPDALQVLIRAGLRHGHPHVRAGAAEALGRAEADEAIRPLGARLRDPHPEVRARAAEALGEIGDPSAEEDLLDAFCRRGEPRVLEALVRIHSPCVTNIIEEAAHSRRYETRMVAAEVWDDVDPVTAPHGVADLLEDKDWRVRSAAIETAARLCPSDVIGPLIERLDEEDGRLLGEVYRTLCRLAGRDLGLEADPWRAWWAVNRDTFDAADAPAGGVAPTQSTFFDVPLRSKRVFFILDLSGSMRDPAPKGEGTKLDAAKRGMAETIRGLERDTGFGILGIGGDSDGGFSRRDKLTWGGRPALRPAAPGVKADALRFVSRLEARGWTNLYDAIAHAFANPDVDTICLYTDGGASKGTFVAAGEIVEQLRRLNRFRRIVIHAVEVPGRSNPAAHRRLLERLASETGGKCRVAKD